MVQAAILTNNREIGMHLLQADKDGGYFLYYLVLLKLFVCDKWRQMLVEAPLCNQVVTMKLTV